MSFFAKLGSGSESDSDSGDESEESILSGDEGDAQDLKLAKGQKGMFERDSDDESEEEDSDEDSDEDEGADSDAGRKVSLIVGYGLFGRLKGMMRWEEVEPQEIMTIASRLGKMSTLQTPKDPLTTPETPKQVLEGRRLIRRRIRR